MNNETLDFQVEHPSNSVQALRDSIATWLVYAVGKDPSSATQRDWLFAIVYAVRERVMDRWSETRKLTREQDAKQLYYLSMEFLMGRMLTNALMAAGIYDETRAACALLGADFDALANLEAEPGLGNGGLGRLAACFMDSLATLGLPAMGYGIRYDYGMFTQRILDGRQVEEPDNWLVGGNPWEFVRPEAGCTVHFGGRVVPGEGGALAWVDAPEDVIATAYDTPVPGYQLHAVATLRLWSARDSDTINLEAFNQGDYFRAVEAKNEAENVSRVLYPEDSSERGRELRLRQEYFS